MNAAFYERRTDAELVRMLRAAKSDAEKDAIEREMRSREKANEYAAHWGDADDHDGRPCGF